MAGHERKELFKQLNQDKPSTKGLLGRQIEIFRDEGRSKTKKKKKKKKKKIE